MTQTLNEFSDQVIDKLFDQVIVSSVTLINQKINQEIDWLSSDQILDEIINK